MSADRGERLYDILDDRRRVLSALIEDSATPLELTERLDGSRSTIDRALSTLREHDLVHRQTDGTYRVSLAGSVAYRRYRDGLETFGDLQETRQALEPLNPETQFDPEIVIEGEIVRNNGGGTSPIERIVERFEAASRVDGYARFGLEPVFEHRPPETMFADSTGSLLVSTDALDEFRASVLATPDRYRERCGFEFHAVSDGPAMGLFRTRRSDGSDGVLATIYADGAVHAVVENETETAIRSATSYIERLRASGSPLPEMKG